VSRMIPELASRVAHPACLALLADPLARAIRGQLQCLCNGLGAAEARECFPSSKKGTSQK
jgi:hypothetical protein